METEFTKKELEELKIADKKIDGEDKENGGDVCTVDKKFVRRAEFMAQFRNMTESEIESKISRLEMKRKVKGRVYDMFSEVLREKQEIREKMATLIETSPLNDPNSNGSIFNEGDGMLESLERKQEIKEHFQN